MGIFDRFKHSRNQDTGSSTALKDRARGMLHGHGDQVNKGADKAGQMVDERTGNRYTDQINTGTGKAKEMLTDEDQGSGMAQDPGTGTDMPHPDMGGMPGGDMPQQPPS